MSARSRPGQHAHVEHARQCLVHAEEAYLKAQGWVQVKLQNDWLWSNNKGNGSNLTMKRSDAVQMAYTMEKFSSDLAPKTGKYERG